MTSAEPRAHRTARPVPRPAAHVVSRRAEVGGIDLHMIEAGRGMPAILIHGLGNSCLVWRRVIPRLAGHHRVVAPDLPGFGHSAPTDARPLLLEYVRIVGALADLVSPDAPVALVGNSVGGAVVLRLAIDRPERVSRLVLVDPAGTGQGVPDWWRLVRLEPLVRMLSAPALEMAPRSLIEAVVGRAYREMAFSDPRRVSGRSIRLFARRLNSRERISRFLENAHDLVRSFEPEVQAREHPLPMPVLVIWGRDDRLVPLHDALALLERIQAAELRIIERAGHLPHIERPVEFVAALDGFLEAERTDLKPERSTRLALQRPDANGRPRVSAPRG